MKLIAELMCQKSVAVTEKFEKVGRIGRGPEGRANANESQHPIRHRMWITCNLLWITHLSTPAAYLSTMAVDTVDNPIAYHNFSVPGIRVFTSAFLIFACCNSYAVCMYCAP